MTRPLTTICAVLAETEMVVPLVERPAIVRTTLVELLATVLRCETISDQATLNDTDAPSRADLRVQLHFYCHAFAAKEYTLRKPCIALCRCTRWHAGTCLVWCWCSCTCDA